MRSHIQLVMIVGLAAVLVAGTARLNSADGAVGRANAFVTANLQYESSALWNQMYDVKVDGGYAYCAMDYGLLVLDVSDVNAPTEAARLFLPGVAARGLALTPGYVLAANQSGSLQIIDRANPTAPSLLSEIALPQSAYGVVADGSVAYVSGQGAVQVVDISSPAVPALIGQFGSAAFGMEGCLVDSLLYLARSELQIFSVSAPTDPVLLGTGPALQVGMHVAVSGHVAFAVDALGQSIYSIDVSSAQSPLLLASHFTGAFLNRIVIRGSWAYVAQSDGVRGYWIADPFNIVAATGRPTGNTQSVALSDDHAFVAAQDSGLYIFPLPTLSPAGSAFRTTNTVRDVDVLGSFAYVTSGTGGIQTVDLSLPAQPAVVGTYSGYSWFYYARASGDHVCALVSSGGNMEIQMLDATDPAQLQPVGTVTSASTNYTDMEVAGSRAYLVSEFGWFRVIDISDPGNPAFEGFRDLNRTLRDVTVEGTTAFVAASGTNGVVVLDCSVSSAPVVLDSLPVADVIGVGSRDSLLYVATSPPDALQVFDVSDPSAPVLLGSVMLDPLPPAHAAAGGIRLEGPFAFMATGWLTNNGAGVLQAVDVRDPTNPRLAGSFATPGFARRLTSDGNHLYLADGTGLLMLSYTETSIDVGNVNLDAVITAADAIYLVNYVFKGGPAPRPDAALGDANCDGIVSSADIIRLINFVFKGGAKPDCS